MLHKKMCYLYVILSGFFFLLSLFNMATVIGLIICTLYISSSNSILTVITITSNDWKTQIGSRFMFNYNDYQIHFSLTAKMLNDSEKLWECCISWYPNTFPFNKSKNSSHLCRLVCSFRTTSYF